MYDSCLLSDAKTRISDVNKENNNHTINTHKHLQVKGKLNKISFAKGCKIVFG